MSNLTDLFPSGAGGKQVEFVASGSIGNGVTVGLNSDGTVTAISGTATTIGDTVEFNGARSNYNPVVFDSNSNKIVIAYEDVGNSDYVTAIVGTVSGTSISFGTPVVIESVSSSWISAAFDSNSNKIVVAYQDDSGATNADDRGKAAVGTVSGTSISFGTPVVFNTYAVNYTSTSFDSTANKIVINYKDRGNSDYGTAIVGTVSGTSISFGTKAVFESANTSYNSSAYDSNANKTVIAYQDGGNGDKGTAVVGTVSGTSISFGTPVVFNVVSQTQYIAAVFDSNANKIVIAYKDRGNGDHGTAIVGTVSGTSISFGPEAVYEDPGDTQFNGIAFDSNVNRVVIVYEENRVGDIGKFVVGEVRGNALVFTKPKVFAAVGIQYSSIAFDSNANKMVVAYDSDLSSGQSVVLDIGTTNNYDFIGISDAAISDTASGSVTIKGGISTNVTGLTPNALYYLQDDGYLASPTAPAPYNLSGASYDSVSFSVNSQEPAPNAVVFNPTGTKMFVVGQTNNTVYEYALATGFDVSTASYTQSFSVSAAFAYSVGLAFNLDGTKMFVADYANSNVYEYALSTGFNVSTASYTQTLSVSTQSSGPSGLVFNLDGTKMFITAFTGQDVNEYSLSTAFDISTATYSQNFSTASQETAPQETVFSSNGKKMFVVGSNTSTIYEYSLSTGYDISTASYSSISFSVSSQEAQSRGLAFNSSGNKFFMCGGFSGGAVYQYSTGAGSTSVLAGKALSSTSINLDYTT